MGGPRGLGPPYSRFWRREAKLGLAALGDFNHFVAIHGHRDLVAFLQVGQLRRLAADGDLRAFGDLVGVFLVVLVLHHELAFGGRDDGAFVALGFGGNRLRDEAQQSDHGETEHHGACEHGAFLIKRWKKSVAASTDKHTSCRKFCAVSNLAVRESPGISATDRRASRVWRSSIAHCGWLSFSDKKQRRG